MYDFTASILEYRNFKIDISKATQDLIDIVDKSRSSPFSWKGQFSPQFIEFLLEEYPKANAILDPFCGSGTVIYEALLNRKQNICGIDINPAAIILAKFSAYSKLKLLDRKELFLHTFEHIAAELEYVNEESIQTALLSKFKNDHLAQCILLNAFRDKDQTSKKLILKSAKYVEEKLINLPYAPNSDIFIEEGDSRDIPFGENVFDLLITSPPYINVFNYHHNYRKSVEALGKLPLIIAKSEIGANRKYRPNRFKTIIQYCIDMCLSLNEMHRVTKYESDIVLIVGNLSTVKGQAFYNGEIIFLISKALGCFEFIKKLERNFMNRYGRPIKEEIIFLKNKKKLVLDRNELIRIGRNIAKFVLNNALNNIDEQHPNHNEIIQAISSIEDIPPGPFIKDFLQ